MKAPSAIAVVPSFWNRLPLVMPVILKWVTSVLSAALRVSTKPEVVWVAGIVLALVTDGVSATGVIVMTAFTVLPASPPFTPLDDACAVKAPVALELAVGVNFSPALPSAKVMKSPLTTALVPSVL